MVSASTRQNHNHEGQPSPRPFLREPLVALVVIAFACQRHNLRLTLFRRAPYNATVPLITKLASFRVKRAGLRTCLRGRRDGFRFCCRPAFRPVDW